MYTFKPDAADVIGDAGLEQTKLAAAAGYDYRELNKRIRKRMDVRHASASKISAAFADLTGLSVDAARAMLFAEVIEEPPPVAEAQRQPLNHSATRPSRRQKRRKR